jgi:hypothetical protein
MNWMICEHREFEARAVGTNCATRMPVLTGWLAAALTSHSAQEQTRNSLSPPGARAPARTCLKT